MTNTPLETELRRAYLNRDSVRTPTGAVGIITSWDRFYEIPGLLDTYVDEIEVKTFTGLTYRTSDYTTLNVTE